MVGNHQARWTLSAVFSHNSVSAILDGVPQSPCTLPRWMMARSPVSLALALKTAVLPKDKRDIISQLVPDVVAAMPVTQLKSTGLAVSLLAIANPPVDELDVSKA